MSVEEYRGLLSELFSAGVPSRREDGVIYSRRMVRDQQERDCAADRQRRHRSNAPVTPMSQEEVRSQRSEVRDRGQSKPAAKPAPPADPRYQPFVDFAYGSFEAKHGQKPHWSARDFKSLKALLGQSQTLALTELERRWNHYSASTEPFTAKQGDSLAYFCAKFDSFIDGPILAGKGNSNGKLVGADLARHNAAALGFTGGNDLIREWLFRFGINFQRGLVVSSAVARNVPEEWSPMSCVRCLSAPCGPVSFFPQLRKSSPPLKHPRKPTSRMNGRRY